MTEVHVTYAALKHAKDLWLEQSQAATTAADTVEDSSSAGFDPDVAHDVTQFRHEWRDIIRTIATRTETLSDDVDAAMRSYLFAEQDFLDAIQGATRSLQ